MFTVLFEDTMLHKSCNRGHGDEISRGMRQSECTKSSFFFEDSCRTNVCDINLLHMYVTSGFIFYVTFIFNRCVEVCLNIFGKDSGRRSRGRFE